MTALAQEDTAGLAFSVEPIVVTASKIEEPLKDVPLTISVIEGEEMEKSQAISVEELLRDLPGVVVQRQGSLGEQTGVRVRGSLFNQCLVMMDGMEVNSPFDGMFDFGDVLIENIDRIEVVEGPHSALYGSEALGGVIHILTKKGEGPPRYSFLGEGGSLSTYRTLISGQGRSGSSRFSLSLGRTGSKGLKEVGRDAFYSNTFSGSMEITPQEGHTLRLLTRYTDSEKELGTDIPIAPILQDGVIRLEKDRNRTLKRGFFLSSLYYEPPPVSGISVNSRASVVTARLDLDNPQDSGLPFTSNVEYSRVHSSRISWEGQATYQPLKTPKSEDILTGGLDYNGEHTSLTEYENLTDLSSGGPGNLSFSSLNLWRYKAAAYIQNIFHWKEFRFDTGVRADINSVLKKVVFNPRVSSRYSIPATNTAFRASWATGLRLPSLKELHVPVVGNPDLKPEKSEGYEIGIVQEIFGWTVGATGFLTEYRDLIAQPVFRLENTDRAIVKGVEGKIGGNILNVFRVNLGGTWQETRKEVWAEYVNSYVSGPLPLVPKYTINGNVTYTPVEAFFFLVNMNWVGPYKEQFPLVDLNGHTIPGTNPGYLKLDSTVNYSFIKIFGPLSSLDIFFRTENILDERYSEASGFPAPPLTVMLGGRLTI